MAQNFTSTYTMISFRFAIFAATVGLAATPTAFADYDAISQFECANCYEKCGFWLFDFDCHVGKTLCNFTVGLLDYYCQSQLSACMEQHSESFSEAEDLVQQANDILVEKNFFTRQFVDSIDVYFCDLWLRWITGQGGLAPTEGAVLLLPDFIDFPLWNLTVGLAHEYYHNMQHRDMGTERLYCEYAESLLSGEGGLGGNEGGNPIEDPAYDFGKEVEKCLFGAEGCRSIPII